jgi:Flp pilus assembly protein TadD
MLRQAGAFGPAYDASVEAVKNTPSQADALAILVESAAATGRQDDAVGVLKGLIASHADLVAPRVALSKLHAAMGALDAAVQAAAAAADAGNGDPLALEQLASIFADAGDAARLAPVVDALSRYPGRPGARYYQAAHHFLRGELEPARAAAAQALALDPRYARAQNLLGAIYATRGETAAARQAFDAALQLDPGDPAIYQNLALLELETGNAPAAAGLFAEALSLDPASGSAREGLARARNAQAQANR